jgi:hypothetical protein
MAVLIYLVAMMLNIESAEIILKKLKARYLPAWKILTLSSQ